MEEDDISEHQQYPEKKRGIKLPLVIGIILGLIIGIIISPFIIDMFSEDKTETPIYQQYTEFESENRTVYKNEKLNVTIVIGITFDFDYIYFYDALWVDINGSNRYTSGHSNPNNLYDKILGYAGILSENQLKWFEYMLNNIVT